MMIEIKQFRIKPPHEKDYLEMGYIPDQAFQVLEVVEKLFQDQLIGVYLYGSAILGGLHINSDVDIFVICNQGLSEVTRKELTKQLMLISGKIGCANTRPLEVTIIQQSDIVPWQFPTKYDYMYGEWLREELEAGVIPQPNYDPDLTILLWQVRSHSYALKGPQAMEVIEPIAIQDVKRAISCCLPELVKSIKGDERNVILTLARMWFTVDTGEISSKDRAALWVNARLPQNLIPLIEMARKAYLGECKDQWTSLDKEIESMADYMKKSIKDLINNE